MPASRRGVNLYAQRPCIRPIEENGCVSSLMAGRKIRKKPDTMAGRIRGGYDVLQGFRVGGAAALEASSRDEFTCCRDADALFMEKDRYLAI